MLGSGSRKAVGGDESPRSTKEPCLSNCRVERSTTRDDASIARDSCCQQQRFWISSRNHHGRSHRLLPISAIRFRAESEQAYTVNSRQKNQHKRKYDSVHSLTYILWWYDRMHDLQTTGSLGCCLENQEQHASQRSRPRSLQSQD